MRSRARHQQQIIHFAVAVACLGAELNLRSILCTKYGWYPLMRSLPDDCTSKSRAAADEQALRKGETAMTGVNNWRPHSCCSDTFSWGEVCSRLVSNADQLRCGSSATHMNYLPGVVSVLGRLVCGLGVTGAASGLARARGRASLASWLSLRGPSHALSSPLLSDCQFE